MFKFKKIISLTLSTVLFVALCSFAYAEEQKTANIFIYPDGTEIEYFLDEEGMPYNNINGEKIYILVPLEKFRVTNPTLIQKLNESLALSQDTSPMLRAAPTSFVDLSTNDPTLASPNYERSVTMPSSGKYTTNNLKYQTAHAQVRVKMSNIKTNGWLDSKNVDLTVYTYDVVFEEWNSYTYTDRNLNTISGMGMQHAPSINQYGKFDISSSKIKSFDVTIWTSPLW